MYCRQPVHDAVKRNVIRILQDIELPKNSQGFAATICFDFLSSPKESVAVKAFSITVLANISPHEPDLKQELIMLIKEQMEWEKPAFQIARKKNIAAIKCLVMLNSFQHPNEYRDSDPARGGTE